MKVALAFLPGVFISEAAASPLHLSPVPSLSSGSDPQGNNDGVWPSVFFEYLNQCSGANLEMESCLVSNAFLALSEMDGPPTNDAAIDSDPMRAAMWFYGEGGCVAPETTEEDLRLVLGGAEEQCASSGDSPTSQELENAVAGFLEVFDPEKSCFQQLCDDALADVPSDTLLGIFFDEAAECAGVDLDINQCLMDQLFDMIAEDSSMEGDAERVRRKLSDSMSDELPECYQPSYEDYALFFSDEFLTAETQCSELGMPVTRQEAVEATHFFASIYSDSHCFPAGCDENDEGTSDDDEIEYSIYPSVTFEYLNQCAEADLEMDSCLVSNTVLALSRWVGSPLYVCNAPPMNEIYLRLIMDRVEAQCAVSGDLLTTQQFDSVMDGFLEVFDSESCFQQLCDDTSGTSPNLYLEIFVGEWATCAGVDLDINQCLMDQLFEMLNGPDSSTDGDAERVRRKLSDAMTSHPHGESHACEWPSYEEYVQAFSSLFFEADTQCPELGTPVTSQEVVDAIYDVAKMFSSAHCLGVVGCDENDAGPSNDDNDPSYLEFIQEKTTQMLGQCAKDEAGQGATENVEEMTCVFSRSVEILHDMKDDGHIDYEDDGHINSTAQESMLSICTAPTDEYNFNVITAQAGYDCFVAGHPVLQSHYNQAVHDLINLISSPDCWEDLCEPEVEEWIVEEWMHTCASMDLEFLTTHGPYMVGDASLDSDRLRCMVDYVASNTLDLDVLEPEWACALPRLGHNVCGADPNNYGVVAREAYFYCGGETDQPSPSPSSKPSMQPTMYPSIHPTRNPTMNPTMQLSMSFAYNDEFNWISENDLDMSFSMSLGFSMPFGDGQESEDVSSDDNHGSELSMYIETVCGLIDELNDANVQDCLEPVCDIGLEDAFGFTNAPSNTPTQTPTATPTVSPVPTTAPTTAAPTSSPTPCSGGAVFTVDLITDGWPEETSWALVDTCTNKTEEPIAQIAQNSVYTSAYAFYYSNDYCIPRSGYNFTIFDSYGDGSGSYNLTYDGTVVAVSDGQFTFWESTSFGACITSAPSAPPSPGPTPAPSVGVQNVIITTDSPSKAPITLKPTSSPTVQQFGSVEVTFEVGVTLEGIDVSELDITKLDDVVAVLTSVFGDLLPPGAIVRLLKVGGFSVTRRLLRFLEDTASGVDVEFEVIMAQTCSSAKCEDSEADEISASLAETAIPLLKAKVESGEATTAIQEKAVALGVSELSDVSVSPSSLQVSEAKITVTDAQEEEDDDSDPPDDDSASCRLGHGVKISIISGLVSMILLLCI